MPTLLDSPSRPGTLVGRRRKEQPFFIFGCPRSGTSLLSKMLGTHPHLAIPCESHLYNGVYPIVQRYGVPEPDLYPHLVAEILQTEHLSYWRPRPSLSATLHAIQRHDFHGIVDGLFRAWALSQGKTRWGEKTPQHTLCWRTILDGFPGLQVIHLVRDGRDVALSYRNAFFGPKHIYPLACRWQQYLSAAEEARACLGAGAFLTLRYEDLTFSPERELRRICVFLQEPFDPSMLAFYRRDSIHADPRNAQNLRKPVMAGNRERWRTEMSDRELRIFEAVAGDTLERYGYRRALRKPTISSWEKLSCRFFESPPRRLASMLTNRQGYRLALQGLRLHLCMRREGPFRPTTHSGLP